MCTRDGCGHHKDMPPIEVPDAERRAFLAGAISLPLAAVLFHPELARAQGTAAVPVTFGTTEGEGSGVLAMPETLPAPAVLLIHEWWGLNDEIRTMAVDVAKQGFIALAIDLYGGELATTPDEAQALMGELDPAVATDQLASAIAFLRSHEDSTGKVGTVGWCFGGGWSLNTALATPVDAAVVYYGVVSKTADELADLDAPLLGHFGSEDGFITPKMVGGFERALEEAGKAEMATIHWYTGDHGFANPSGARYDADDAALAWARTLAFFHEHLAG